MKPRTEILQEGATILEPVLAPHAFTFRITDSGRGSGGDFACGDFSRGAWRLELNFRFSLGLVTYHHGSISLGHDQYLFAVTGRHGAGRYPGFSDKPLDGFHGLAHDLETFCGAFLHGDSIEFDRIYREASRLAEEWRKTPPFKRLSI